MKLKTSDWFIFGTAILAAIIAVILVYGYLQNRIEQAESQAKVKTITVVEKPKLSSVVVANRDIFRGEKLEVGDLKVLNVPVDGVVTKGVITNPQNAVGHVANQNLYAGEWLINKKLSIKIEDDTQNIKVLLEKNRRAMRVPVEAETGLLGILNPGDNVDIISVFESADNKKMISRAILQNVTVLSIGQYNRMTIKKSGVKDALADPEYVSEKSMIAVDVNIEQAEKLALAMNVGSVHLILRNPADTELVATKGVNLKMMEKGKRRMPKYKIKSRRDVIEIMQGGDVQKVRVR